MNKPPAFQFYVQDFLTGTTTMTNAEVGAYIRLLCHEWDVWPLPSDRNELRKLSRGGLTGKVLAKFKPLGDGLINERLESERTKQQDFREKQSIRARRGTAVAQPWLIGGEAERMPSAAGFRLVPEGCSSSSSSSSSSKEGEGSDFVVFVKGWCEEYKRQFKVDYKFAGGRDGKAVKQLLLFKIELTKLLAMASAAWKMTTFEGRQAQTVHGFLTYFNQINIAVEKGGVVRNGASTKFRSFVP